MIAIIDYEGGNLTSVQRAVRHIGFDGTITNDATEIDRAERLIFPGVGAAGASMDVLDRTGLTDVVKTQVLEKKKPFLAICIGIQILFEYSEEDDQQCLGILKGNVKRFPESELKIPQIGWNQVHQVMSHALWQDISQDARFYFVHSYYVEPANPDMIAASSSYGFPFTAAVTRDNVFAVQFHPEKSQHAGLKLYENFLKWDGKS